MERHHEPFRDAFVLFSRGPKIKRIAVKSCDDEPIQRKFRSCHTYSWSSGNGKDDSHSRHRNQPHVFVWERQDSLARCPIQCCGEEKLASVDFVDFKILVSKDFHFDWQVPLNLYSNPLDDDYHFNRHEHLYHKIDHNVLRSDNFAGNIVGADRQLLGSRVILCTLSMLANDKIRVFTDVVPIQTVMFDEASQIEIGDYLPMLIRFRPSLRKMIFIGDNKQCESDGLPTLFILILPSVSPYGSSDIPTLQSIFEKSHMLTRAVFLDTQC